MAQLATAALLLVTLVGSLLAFGPGRPGQRGAVPAILPGLIATPATPSSAPALAEFVAEIPLSGGLRGSPAGVAVDANGTLYVTNSLNDQIRVFDRERTLIATWGESGAGPGQFQFEGYYGTYGDLAFGPDGNLYVLDPYNSRIQVLSPDGTYLRAWGEEGAGEGQFNLPTGIGIDTAGRVYVTELANKRLQVFDSEGQFLATWDGSEADGGPVQTPVDVAVDAAGIVSVTDFFKNRILRFDAAGAAIDTVGGELGQPGRLSEPGGIAVDPQGTLYVADNGSGQVQVFASDGTWLGGIESVATKRGAFPVPINLTIGADGLLYVADASNQRVQVFRLLPPLGSAKDTPAAS
jgi:DNA-binding beta-propeller fold protein YncE